LDELDTPLASAAAKPKRPRLPLRPAYVVAGVLGLFLAVFVAWSILVEDRLGGEPMATAALRSLADAADGPNGDKAHARHDGAAQPAKKSELPPGSRTVTIIDGSSGARQEVIIPPTRADEKGQGAQQKTEAGVDERLLEGTRHGRIPRIGANGLRPIDVYGHSADAAPLKPGAVRVAIVVGGLGVSAAGTADALSRLPPAVTLAFAPYGANLESLATRARQGGHELLLQTPMEPFDYPDNDPGPQTLLTSLAAEQNLDRLHWVMARLQGYVGITNYMGARFTASEKALAPMLDDISKRGLLYLDDGSSARSVAAQIAGANNMPFAKADEVIDAVTAPSEIDRALARLEAEARKRGGVAIGTATALPVSIERIVRWAKDAESRGVVLVPVSVAALKPKSS
jgi:polysaccharide deacetylase 2 family uncharacterized protein YibQ